jgi:hypothetical protein
MLGICFTLIGQFVDSMFVLIPALSSALYSVYEACAGSWGTTAESTNQWATVSTTTATAATDTAATAAAAGYGTKHTVHHSAQQHSGKKCSSKGELPHPRQTEYR